MTLLSLSELKIETERQLRIENICKITWEKEGYKFTIEREKL